MRTIRAIPLMALAVAVAGCGGGVSKHYDASEVRGCLVDKNLSMKPADLPGDVSPDGTEGDLAVEVGENEVDLAFGKDSSEAKSNAQAENAAATPSAPMRMTTFERRAMSPTGSRPRIQARSTQ